MKENKKLKLKNLNFYIIDENYINYLSQFDKHIAYNKDQTRPYVGVVLVVESHYYFAPLFSPKLKHKSYKDNLTFFKISNLKAKKDLGIIRFSDMIPVPIRCVIPLNLQDKSYGYKRLLHEQYSCINTSQNKLKITYKSEKIYYIVTSSSNTKMSKFYKDLSCDFKLLEQKSLEYKN
jgi:protein AbiQ